MAVKIFRSVWFLSVLAILFVLLYQYAAWPETVVIGQGEVNFISLSRDNFFYVSMALLAFVNVTVYIVKNFAKESDEFQSWFYGFIAVINFFLVIALSFISLFNSSEDFRFGQIGFIIYGSLILVFSWIAGGLLYWFVRKRLQAS